MNIDNILHTINQNCLIEDGKEFTYKVNMRKTLNVYLRYTRLLIPLWFLLPNEKKKYDMYKNKLTELENILCTLPSGIKYTLVKNISDDRENKECLMFADYYENIDVEFLVSRDYSSRVYKNNLCGDRICTNSEHTPKNIIDDVMDYHVYRASINFQYNVISQNVEKVDEIITKLNNRYTNIKCFAITKTGVFVGDVDEGNVNSCAVSFQSIGMKPLVEEYMIYGFARAMVIKLCECNSKSIYKLKLKQINYTGYVCSVNLCEIEEKVELMDWGNS